MCGANKKACYIWRISDKAKEIIAYSFAGVIGIQLSKLMAIGKEDFSETKQRKYIEKCLQIAKRSVDLVCFALISRMLDAPTGAVLHLSDDLKTVLQRRFDEAFEPTLEEQFRLLQVLRGFFGDQANGLETPMPELNDLAQALQPGSDLHQTLQNLHALNGKLDKGQYDLLDCFEAETQLAAFFRHFHFLANYRMASIKHIGYRHIRNEAPRYLIRYAALGIDSKANIDAEKVNYSGDTVQTEAVLLYRGDEHRQADALLSLDTLKKIGNIGDVLRDFLDEQVLLIARTLDQKPDAIWQILSPLVTLDGTKEPLSGPDLCNRRPEMAATLIDSTLQALVKGRILRFSEHNQRYEIAHDSLAKQIAAKRSDEEIALLEVQRMIKSQVAMKAEAREFFSEKQLAFMEPYLKKLTLGAEENTHLENSRKFLRQKKKKQQRRKKVTYASIAAAFVLLAALALWALGQKKTAEESLEKVERTEIVKKAEELKTYGDSYRDLQKDSASLDTYRQAWDTLDFYGNKHPELRDEEVYQALKKILNK